MWREALVAVAEGSQPEQARAARLASETRMPSVDLPGRFSNSRPALETLIRRVLRGPAGRGPRSRLPERHDARGPVAKNPAKSQTRLTSERRAELVTSYEARMPVQAICAKYGVHRGTVSVLARRAGVSVRAPGLDEDQRAQAAALYAGG